VSYDHESIGNSVFTVNCRYGALEGHSKPGLAKLFGEETVQAWRSGLHNRPPEMSPQHLYYHGFEQKYRNLFSNSLKSKNYSSEDCVDQEYSIDGSVLSPIPCSESLQDTLDRTIPLWDSHILPDLKAGRNVMIVAHRNSLRGIVKHIDNLPTTFVQKMAFPNGIPLVYKFDKDMKPIRHTKAAEPLSAIWLEKEVTYILYGNCLLNNLTPNRDCCEKH
jgi:2,3-bisphosphoglycerate-dependent phosphoglycerate mutase